MKYKIAYQEKTDEILSFALSKMTERIRTSIEEFINKERIKHVNEIRLHKESEILLIADSRNIATNIYVFKNEIEEIIESLCGGSIYAHAETIRQGYISVGNGIRAGICGKAVLDEGTIGQIRDISSINIRIPNMIFNASSYVFDYLKEENFNKSILLYSSPGVGKTTILRDLVSKISQICPPIRMAIIDSKEEITGGAEVISNADVYLSYPKGVGIEMATKSMTPQLIICDEITTAEEADAILKSVHSGVNFIATAHASSFCELMSKPILSSLIKSGAFDTTIGVTRGYGEKKYTFTKNLLGEKS